ncbi:MAG: DUF2249 domain-containing protein [Verrucomicrobiota bacterium]
MTLDVRPLLAQGIEPFGAIVEAKSQLSAGQPFVLRAPFEPLPLYNLFQNDGYQVDAKKHADDDWEIHFIPGSAGGAPERELDLRFLEPPDPLQNSLEGVRALGRDERLVLHTRFRPVQLFERIDAETTDYDCEEVGPNHWVTTLWRIAG